MTTDATRPRHRPIRLPGLGRVLPVRPGIALARASWGEGT